MLRGSTPTGHHNHHLDVRQQQTCGARSRAATLDPFAKLRLLENYVCTFKRHRIIIMTILLLLFLMYFCIYADFAIDVCVVKPAH